VPEPVASVQAPVVSVLVPVEVVLALVVGSEL
jgi:hypothetical protein